MNDLPAPQSSANIFMVRIWLEWSNSGSCWRGQILHVQSGQKAAFLCLEDMLSFIQGHVAMPKADRRELPRAE